MIKVFDTNIQDGIIPEYVGGDESCDVYYYGWRWIVAHDPEKKFVRPVPPIFYQAHVYEYRESEDTDEPDEFPFRVFEFYDERLDFDGILGQTSSNSEVVYYGHTIIGDDVGFVNKWFNVIKERKIRRTESLLEVYKKGEEHDRLLGVLSRWKEMKPRYPEHGSNVS